MKYVAGNAMCNATVSEAKQLLAMLAAAGVTGGVIVACPAAAATDTAAELVPEAEFAKEGVPITTPAYLMLQFPGNEKYPNSYTVGMCLYMIAVQKIPPVATVA